MKRNALFLIALLLGLGHLPARATENSGTDEKVLRIGYQKYGTLIIVKALGHLDSSLSKEGWKVSWFQFPAGPQLLEGLNANAIDFGIVGEAPPIFAQASGTPLVYVANEPASPEAEAILVPKDSPIRKVSELKGKRVVLNKGSNVHYLLVQALKKAGLKYTDIQTVFLPPADARAAFESGKVDAWVIWDPFEGVAQKATGARVLVDGKGLVANHQFYFGSRTFVATHPEEVNTVIKFVQEADRKARENVQEVAGILAPEVGIDTATLIPILKRSNFGAVITRTPVIAEQQKIADAFFSLGLIPKQIAVKDDQWNDAPKEIAKTKNKVTKKN